MANQITFVAVTTCWGFIDEKLSKPFNKVEDATEYAKKMIAEISDTNGDYLTDADIEDYAENVKNYVCDSDNNIKVQIITMEVNG